MKHFETSLCLQSNKKSSHFGSPCMPQERAMKKVGLVLLCHCHQSRPRPSKSFLIGYQKLGWKDNFQMDPRLFWTNFLILVISSLADQTYSFFSIFLATTLKSEEGSESILFLRGNFWVENSQDRSQPNLGKSAAFIFGNYCNRWPSWPIQLRQKFVKSIFIEFCNSKRNVHHWP